MRTRDSAATRAQLLAAGAQLAKDGSITTLTVGRVVENAGTSKGAFFHHFPSRDDYVLALHRDFHDRVVVAVATAIATLEPGRARLLAGARAYWELCLRERGMLSLLVAARVDPIIAEEARDRFAVMESIVALDLAALGVEESAATAPLVVAMITEVAAIEERTGKVEESTRAALETLLTAHSG